MEEKKEKRLKKIKEVIKKHKKEKEEYLQGWKRAKADYLNYKKDEHRRISTFLLKGKEDLFLKILPILDNFNRAEKEAKKRKEKDDLLEGFLKIKNQLDSLLKEEGVEEIEIEGEEFDPLYHEAIEVREEKGQKSGTIIEEVEKGYLFQGKVIRPAKVKVVK